MTADSTPSLSYRLFGGGVELPPEGQSRANLPADGPLLLILHGLYGDADNWQTQAKALSDRALVVVPDLPNHGRSPWIDAAAYDRLAPLLWRWFEPWIAANQRRPVYLMGHSMGGKLSMAMAFVQPETVAGLIVVDMAPRPYPPRHEAIFAGLQAVQNANPTTRTQAEQILGEHVPQKEIRLFLMKSFLPGAEGRCWRMNVSFLAAHQADLVGWPFAPTSQNRYEGAAMVLFGERSDYVHAGDEQLIHQYLPRAQLSMVADAGHWLHAEQRDRFLAMVRSFLP